MKFILLLLVYTSLSISKILCDSECVNFKTCSGCIQYSYDTCVWCSADDHEHRRCQSEKYAGENTNWCKVPIYNPSSSKIVLQNDDFNAIKEKGRIVQFKPQKLEFKARPGVAISFNMSYKPAKDYPLDVYYLMDYSFTMKNHAAELQRQGLQIYKGLTALTNNVRLGIGSFIEKPALPLASGSESSYSFKNHLSLTANTTLFAKALEKSPDGSNNDKPEAGFDALMQVMACTEEIDWRKEARRIIVLCTDSTYHSAGDGKFVGAIVPNDMQCHMKDNKFELTLDYPSVSQINKKAMDTNTKIIFAVDSKTKLHYEALEKKIQGSKYVPLSTRSSIVDMIQNEYLDLVRSLRIDSNVPPFMELKLHPDCSKSDVCQVKHDQPVEITGKLLVKTCPTSKELNYLLKIGPISLNEKLEIMVKLDCECDCEKNGINNSTVCSQAGTYQCGICSCNDNRYGKTCNCVGASAETTDLDQCKANDGDVSLCSGHGICRCGKCECQAGFSGDFCAFDDNACPRPGDMLCAGHGHCKFGRCECDPHWIGEDCQCPDNDQTCVAPISNEICSGKGQCKCGVCMCEQKEATNEICTGRFCDDCEELKQKRCKELEDYVYCNYNFNKTECDEKYNQTSTGVTVVNITEIHEFENQNRAKWCRKLLDDGSSLIYLYYYPPYSSNTLEIKIQKELEAAIKADVWVAVGSAIGAVLLIGLLTLLVWKYLVDLHDEREYKKFELEYAKCCDESQNPLYQAPEMKFSNPAYRGGNDNEECG